LKIEKKVLSFQAGNNYQKKLKKKYIYIFFSVRKSVRADAPCFTPGNFKKDATVRPSHRRPRGHRPSVRKRPRDNPAPPLDPRDNCPREPEELVPQPLFISHGEILTLIFLFLFYFFILFFVIIIIIIFNLYFVLLFLIGFYLSSGCT
jgi:hypothetical protein